MAGSKSQSEHSEGPLSDHLNGLELSFCVNKDDSKGPFVLGDKFSVAECFAAPWVHRFEIVLPHFRSVEVEDLSTSSVVKQWMLKVMNRPSVQATNGPTDYLLTSTQGYFVNHVTEGSPASLV